MNYIRFAFTALLLSACKHDPPPVVVREAPVVKATAITEPDPVPPKVSALVVWSAKPPHPEGAKFEMSRTTDHLRFVRGDVRIETALPALGDCVEDIPQVETPPDMLLNDVRDAPVWLRLQGDGESASLRLSTRGALLLVDDGCLRATDLTPSLLGTGVDSDDPIFAADSVAPDDAVDSTDLTMRRAGTSTAIAHQGAPWIDVAHFPGEVAFTARATETDRWARLVVAVEKESRGGESAIGREHTLVWAPDSDGAPLLLLENDFRFGADGADHEENRTVATRARVLPDGTLRAHGERAAIDDAVNVGAGRCPEMEGVLAFRHRRETVQWTFETRDQKERSIGSAKRTATFASGCLDAAREEASRRHRLLADRAEKGRVAWKHTPQTPAD